MRAGRTFSSSFFRVFLSAAQRKQQPTLSNDRQDERSVGQLSVHPTTFRRSHFYLAMPPAPLTTISLLAAGALAGAGVAAIFGNKKKDDLPVAVHHPITPSPPPPSSKTNAPPTTTALETDLLDRRLLALAAQRAGGAIESSGYPGPISDLLTHTAYISAYDRKLRHPAWVSRSRLIRTTTIVTHTFCSRQFSSRRPHI